MSEYIQHDQLGVSVGRVEKREFTFAQPPAPMQLACGATLGPVTIAYETCGRLNEERNNAILILHALSGDAHVAGTYSDIDDKPG